MFNISFNHAQENNKYTDWLIFSNSSSNRVISEIIDKTDLTRQITIIESLGKRKDRDFNLIIENIYYKNNSTVKEVLLFHVFKYMINSKNDFQINKNICRIILSDIVGFSDSLLRKELIKTTDFADRNAAVKSLASEGKMLSELSVENGRLGIIISEEYKVFNKYSKKYNEPVLDQLNDIIYRNAADSGRE